MREILTIPIVPVAGAELLCPAGKEIRILAVRAGVGGIAEGDAGIMTINWSSQVGMAVVTNPLTVATVTIGFLLGAMANAARLMNIDPVTGAATYDQTCTEFITASPDLWITEAAVLVSVSILGVGTVTDGTILYERRNSGWNLQKRLTRQKSKIR